MLDYLHIVHVVEIKPLEALKMIQAEDILIHNNEALEPQVDIIE